jgi:hypothetical protein
MILAWTAAFALLLIGAILAVLGFLALVSVVLPPGKLRLACQLLLAILGLLAAALLAW